MKKGIKILIIVAASILVVSGAAGLILDRISDAQWDKYLEELHRSPADITGSWKRYVQVYPENAEMFWGHYVAEMAADGTYAVTEKDSGKVAERGTYIYRDGALTLTTENGTVSFELESNTPHEIYLGDFTLRYGDGSTAMVQEMWSRDQGNTA